LVPWEIAINWAVRGVFAEWDTLSFLFSVACDDAVWVVLNNPGGRCRPDQISWLRLILSPMLALLPVTFSNAPRMPGQLGWRVEPLSVSRFWIA
jgi:hypothetical protein